MKHCQMAATRREMNAWYIANVWVKCGHVSAKERLALLIVGSLCHAFGLLCQRMAGIYLRLDQRPILWVNGKIQ